MIEPVHFGSNSILKVRFFGTPCIFSQTCSARSGMKDIEPIMDIMIAILLLWQSFKEKEGKHQTQYQFRDTDWFSGTVLSGCHRIKTEHNQYRPKTFN